MEYYYEIMNMRCFIIFSILFFCPTQSLLMYNKVSSQDHCLHTICEITSGCVPHGCSLDVNGRIGCGYFLLNIYQYNQCYQPGKKEDEDEETAWINCSHDYQCSASCIKILSSRFRVKCYGKNECETMARIQNGGANGCRSRDTAGFWKQVKEKCGSDCTLVRRH